MVSVITFTNGHSLIWPVVTVTRLGSLKVRAQAGLLVVVKKDNFSGFKELKKKERFWVNKDRFLCKGSLESDAELGLEQEILEFMKISKNPDDFPTKKELLEAGRVDLVNAIAKKGGWLSFGWDDDSDSGDESECGKQEFDDLRDVHTRNVSSQLTNELASSSGRPLETVVQDDAGIEGILHRLEKYRSLSFGISGEGNERGIYGLNKDNGSHRDLSTNVATDTYSGKKSGRGDYEDSIDKLMTTKDGELHKRRNEIDSNYIKSRLQKMQSELSSAICLFRSKSETNNPDGHKYSSSELQHLSDTWEFQENEIMNAKDRLRSIRAELAVSEGKMALSIIEAHKLLEAKQKRIDSACRTLQILHTTCIIWPNSASEVLLAGSFDGWTTQRKMERSQTGIFSLSLKLYPGRYEIKFIVDGVWRVDPLRPIANNNGYENNVLIIHD
uniref:protein PTST homolog 2, chloroplastic isoform X2 n=1 Tax=Erigeron canadensis TaxID=72917 RepID=UPI001CB8A055|nr:protein PTST homolog 2, chloroplastic isoform X2 [Erigeron canadensis]